MDSHFPENDGLYASVFQAIDASIATEGSLATTDALLQRALSRTRASGAAREEVAQLELVSVGLQKMMAAALSGNKHGCRSAGLEMRRAAARWCEQLPMH